MLRSAAAPRATHAEQDIGHDRTTAALPVTAHEGAPDVVRPPSGPLQFPTHYGGFACLRSSVAVAVTLRTNQLTEGSKVIRVVHLSFDNADES